MDPNDIITEIDAFSAETGLKPTTICEKALSNSRFYDRLKRRIERSVDEASTLRGWMAAYRRGRQSPTPTREEDAA